MIGRQPFALLAAVSTAIIVLLQKPLPLGGRQAVDGDVSHLGAALLAVGSHRLTVAPLPGPAGRLVTRIPTLVILPDAFLPLRPLLGQPGVKLGRVVDRWASMDVMLPQIGQPPPERPRARPGTIVALVGFVTGLAVRLQPIALALIFIELGVVSPLVASSAAF